MGWDALAITHGGFSFEHAIALSIPSTQRVSLRETPFREQTLSYRCRILTGRIC